MSEYRFTDQTATVVVLNGLVRDMRHALEWLTIALGCLALVQVIAAVHDAKAHDWAWVALDLIAAAVFAQAAYSTAKRAAKYRGRR